MTERSNSQVLGATLLGGMVGAGLALLFAPRSGKETRNLIQDNAMKVKDSASDKMHSAKSRMHRGVEDARDLKERLAEAAHTTGKKGMSELDEIKANAASRKRRQSPVLSAWEEEV
jgi:gas vesicle protein